MLEYDNELYRNGGRGRAAVINDHRKLNTYTAKRLRRARRLYFKLVRPYIPDGVDGKRMVLNLVDRVQESGLYSPSTSKRDLAFSVYRQMYQCDKRMNHNHKNIRRDKCWYEWLVLHGYGRAPWFDDMPEKRRIRA